MKMQQGVPGRGGERGCDQPPGQQTPCQIVGGGVSHRKVARYVWRKLH